MNNLFNATGVYGDNASLDMNEGWIEILPVNQVHLN